MRVLLLQEMSGVHTELREGLRQIGVDVDLATLGQGFRKYSTDINIGTDNNDKISSLKRIIRQVVNISKFRNYDVIQSISPYPFHKLINNYIENLVYDEQKKIIYIAAGSDPIYRKHIRELSYWPQHNEYGNERQYEKFINKLIKTSSIIPVCWEYEYSVNRAGLSTEKVIPFPINLKKQKYTPLRLDKTITVFHPLNRPQWHKYDFKGTKYILEAFEILNDLYKGKVNFIAKGGMSSKEYDEFTNNVDIIVDQCRSYSYGMSAAYGLAKGKIVLSGLEDKVKHGHYTECPVINIRPETCHIVNKLDALLKTRENLKALSEQSRSFAEKYHSSDKVAKQYLDVYLK